MTESALRRMTAAEYLRAEESSDFKSECIDGFVYPLHAQAGASKRHVRLTTNLLVVLHGAVSGQGCRLYASDMKIMVDERSFFYPDVMVCCGPENPETQFETDACIIVEVLSPSTAAHDRTGKFAAYRRLRSFQMYLLAEPNETRIYAYAKAEAQDTGAAKNEDGWVLTEYGEGDVIALPCLNAELDLARAYAGLE